MSATSSRIFKFKGFIPAFTVLMFFVALWILFAITIPLTGGGIGGSAFCLLVAALLLLLGRVFLIGKSDVVLDDKYISRVFLGKVIQRIPWIGVQRIVVYPIRAAGVKRNVTAYNIFASASSGNETKTRKIYFNDQSTDLKELIELLNFYTAKYQIRVEHVSDGRTTIKNAL